MKRQLTPDGLLVCNRCKQPKPPNHYSIDKSNPLGRAYQCRPCMAKHTNKRLIIEPEMAIVAFGEVEGMVWYPEDRVAPGFWRKVVEQVPGLLTKTAIKVRIEDNYYSHYAAYAAMKQWSKKLGIPVTVLHGDNFVLVKRTVGSKRQSAIGLSAGPS